MSPVELIPITCPGCGAHLADWAGGYVLLRGDRRQRVVCQVKLIRCFRQVTGEGGSRRCNAIWEP